MNKIFKHLPIFFGVLVGIVMYISNISFSIENIFYVFVIFAIIFAIIYTFIIMNVKKQIKKYLLELKIDLIKEEKFIKNNLNEQLKCILLINISVAYSLKENYEKSISILNDIDISKQSLKVKAIYYNNLAYFLYKNGQKELAKKVVEENETIFEEFLSDITVAPMLLDTINTIQNDK